MPGHTFSHKLHCIQFVRFIFGYLKPSLSSFNDIHCFGQICIQDSQPQQFCLGNVLII